MRVSLIKSDKISDLILPSKVKGNYWITDTDDQGIERNLISIEASNGKWKIVSNSEVYCTLNDTQVPSTELNLYNFYVLKSIHKNSVMILYCSPVYDNTYQTYSIEDEKSREITIGRNSSCDISYNSINISDIHATINHVNDRFQLTPKSVIYVNDLVVSNQITLNNGDIIFIMGLKLIFSIKNGSPSLIINNPANLVNVRLKVQNNIKEDDNFTELTDEVELDLYNDDDNFHKKPRFLREVEKLQINVDSPPAKPAEDDRPWILTVGPMFTMSMMSLTSAFSALNNLTEGNTSLKRALPSLLVSGAMMCGTLLWPTISRRYEKKKRAQNEKERQAKYRRYIDEKREEIRNEITNQRNILIDNYPTTMECQNIILSKMTRLWERRIGDNDFLKVNLGIGSEEMEIEIKYPEEHFSIMEDELVKVARELGQEPKNIDNVSITLSLQENNVLGIVGNSFQTSTYMSQLILQLMTFHSYDDLKIVMLTNKDKAHNWEYLKILPHCFSNDKSIRFYGENNDDYKEIFYYLDKELNDRTSTENKNPTKKPQYLIITDNFKSVRNYDFIKRMLNLSNNLGFSMVILTKKITNIPDQCKSFVNIFQEKAELYLNKVNNKAKPFTIDLNTKYNYYECAKTLANIHIDIESEVEGQLPKKIGFLQMYEAGKIEQLNASNRWKKNNPMLSLAAPVGIGKSGEKIVLDLHEKYHGPHGLIAGMTGSGKSEFIITFIVSMAINYHPYEVQFILIDYKGGGLTGAFENNTIGLKLPHLVGTITNLDTNEIKRSLSSIESELKRRQRLFNIAREKSGESTIDIYKYQKMYREGLIDEPVSHLFIISDEFAELKKEQPEFMTQLISTARIGRSLGVHLILATQKPSGVVDPQIWSNTRFRVCLRVQDKSDSTEVIKRPDAAYLKQTGRFYFQVGFDEIFVIGQAAWCGGQYFPSETIRKEIDSSINFIDNIGNVIKNVETKKQVEVGPSQGEELINIVKYLDNIAKEENIKCKPLWLAKIPDTIYVNDLMNKYKYQKENFVINPIIGEFDVPSMQQQYLLTLPLSKEGNALIYGSAGSGKENLVTTLLYSSMINYTPQEVNYYLVDFGSESLNMFKKSPIIGDILHVDDKDKLNNLYKMLNTIIEIRKKLFSEYNGDYDTYCKKSGKTVPSIVVIINNFEAYHETYADYDDILTILSRDGSKYGVYFVLTVSTPNGLRFKLKQNFTQEYVLQQNSPDDYTSILGNVKKNYPSKIFGRGIFKKEDVYEFQTAYAYEKDNIQDYIKSLCIKHSEVFKERAKPIPILPEVVTYNDIKDDISNDKNVIIGIAKQSLNAVKFDFNKTLVNGIISSDINYIYSFVKPFVNQLMYLNYSKVTLINTEEIKFEDNYKKYIEYIDNDFNAYFLKLYNYIIEKNDEYIKNNYSRNSFKDIKHNTIIILGYETFANRLSPENKKKLGTLFEKAKDLEIVNFIIMDSVDKFKKLEIEFWYKTCANPNDGIWIGPGVNDQYTLKVSQRTPELKEQINEEFCFVIKRGKPTLVKYVSKFDLNLK